MAASGRENGPSSFVNGSGLPDLAPRYVQSAGSLAAAASTLLAGFVDPALASSADVTYFGGSIVAVNDAQPSAEAVAIKDGKITAIGTRAAQIQRFVIGRELNRLLHRSRLMRRRWDLISSRLQP
jgi:hypothetical protein